MSQRQQIAAAGAAILLLPLLIVLLARLGGAVPGERIPVPEGPPAATPLVTPPVAEVTVAEARRAGAPVEVASLMEDGRFWRAARLLRERGSGDGAAAVLLRAKAEAGWGGWRNVLTLLEGRPWLDGEEDGDGWYLLGRAREDAGRWNEAADAYARYARLREGTYDAREMAQRAVAELRHARALLRAGAREEGVRALREAGRRTPVVEGWTTLLAAEALAPTGDTARVRRLVEALDTLPSPARARVAYLRAYQAAADVAGTGRLAERYLAEVESPAERAPLAVAAGRALLELGEAATARERLRPVLDEAPETAAAVDAARLLERAGGLTPADRLAIGRVYDRHGNRPRAIDGYRAFLASGEGSAELRREVQLRLVRALFAAARYPEVDAAARPLFDAGPEVGGEARFVTGRAQFRRGDRAAARATWLATADRYPGSDYAANGLFLIADLAHDAGDRAAARAGYRRAAAAAPHAERAGLAMMRLGGMDFLAGSYAAAAGVFAEYRRLNPTGPYWPQATYWEGRALAAQGDASGAVALWREVREREPLSYYALRAAERMGEPFWPVRMEADPRDTQAEERRVALWRYGLDLLREAGLETEALAEVERRIREAGEERGLLYPWLEVVNERGYTSQGLRAAVALQRAGEPVSDRFLRLLHPLPYRGIVRGEAERNRVEPAMVAALIRQESWFNHRARSPVGARGLMQVMPATGRGLAPGVGISQWNEELLDHPEINVALGTRFLSDQMRRYDRSLPSVFSAYNAGPGRVRQWSAFPEHREEELFTERIPFQETRDYVKILTRNAAIYAGLYGAELRGR